MGNNQLFVLLFSCYYELFRGVVFNLANIPDNQNSYIPEKQGTKIPFKIIGGRFVSQTIIATEMRSQLLGTKSRVKICEKILLLLSGFYCPYPSF